MNRPWDDESQTLDNALKKIDAAFEFFTKLGVEYYTFHDTDIAPEGKTLQETEIIFNKVTDHMLEL